MLFLYAIAIIVIIGLVLYNMRPYIPETIWTYWHDDNIPPLVKRCIETWRKMNANYQIVVLTPQLFEQLTNINLESLNIREDLPARRADFIRLFIIYKYGGIWMDSTIICTRPLTWVQTADLCAFKCPKTTNPNFPIPENWFLAAPKESPFIKDWIDEALYMLTFPSEQVYVDYITQQNKVNMQNLPEMLPYLVMHLCAIVVMQRNPKKYNLHIIDSTSANGPFKYLEDNKWEPKAALMTLCTDESYHSPIIKLRKLERQEIEDNHFKCEHNKNSIVAEVIGI